MPSTLDLWRIIAGLLGLSAVMIGAIAAHALSDAQAVISVERAANYQLIHAVLLVVTTVLTGKFAALSRWCFLFGLVFFSGSIYAKYGFGLVDATKFAPTGGVLLMLGWLSLALSTQARAK